MSTAMVNRIVIDPTIAALGYGIEYSYSIMERARNGALQGDKMLAMPMIGNIGAEAWRAKEANIPGEKQATTSPSGMADKDYFVHESSYVDEPCEIGKGTTVFFTLKKYEKDRTGTDN